MVSDAMRKVIGSPELRNEPSLPPQSSPAANPDGEIISISALGPETEGRDEVNGEFRHRMICEAAYRLYVERGCQHGFALADWLQAEAHIDDLLGISARRQDT